MRSLLFVPGDSPRKLEKGLSSGADVLLIDLEDSVALPAKADARRITLSFLAASLPLAGRPRLYVRVNGLTTGLTDADLDGIMQAAPDGIVLPKAVGGQDVSHLGAKIAVREAEFGLADGGTRILAIATETAPGRFRLGHLRRCEPPPHGPDLGRARICRRISARRPTAGTTALYADPYRLARSLTLMGAAAAEVEAIDSVFTHFRDLEGLATECREARRDGFVAKMAIHPAQVPVINEAFTPSPEALARAQAVVDAFAADPGVGVVGVDGEMLDRPHLKRAERVLARAAGRQEPGRRSENFVSGVDTK